APARNRSGEPKPRRPQPRRASLEPGVEGVAEDVLVERALELRPALGCDDIFGADFCNPPLSTMASPIEQAGRVAVSMLLAQLNPLAGGGTRSRSVMPTHLTVRGSTGPVRQAQ
ncbi:substrate-binding domain-containing protein, partial [Arthrobacter sp. I3]|uniref:substrate-binding domain-containing protein n=1 Tax=Arthrobacter sp. I3 TaxID=218158 RepID=UPI0020A6396E